MAVSFKENPLTIVLKINAFSELDSYSDSDSLYMHTKIKASNHYIDVIFDAFKTSKWSCDVSVCSKKVTNSRSGCTCRFELICYDGYNLCSKEIKMKPNSENIQWRNFISSENVLKNKSKYLLNDCLTLKIFMWGIKKTESKLKSVHCYSEMVPKYKCSLKWNILGLNINTTYLKELNSLCDLNAIKLTYSENGDIKLVIEKSSEVYLKTKLYLQTQSSKCNIEMEYCSYDKNKIVEFPMFNIGQKTEADSNRNFIFEFHFYFMFRENREEYELESDIPQILNSISAVSQDILQMFTEQKMTDVCLQVGGKKLFAHKFVLMSRSPVFSAMFERDMLEKQNNVVDIQDVSYEVLNEFLLALYGAKLPNLNFVKAVEMIVVANRYQFSFLQQECSEFLCSCLCEKNFCEILSISDMVYDTYLKRVTFEFFKDNCETILSSENWKELSESNNKLAMEVLTAYAREK